MRISDWSSDVCSSDLDCFTAITGSVAVNHVGSGSTSLYGEHSYSGDTRVAAGRLFIEGSIVSNTWVGDGGTLGGTGTVAARMTVEDGGILAAGRADRSEERRVGKEWVRTCKSRCAPDH